MCPQDSHSLQEDSLSQLHEAAGSGDLETVQQLLQKTPQLAAARVPGSGEVPLHSAARHGSPELVRLLLAVAPDSAGITNSRQETPLLLAVQHRHVEAARLLVAAAPAAAVHPTHRLPLNDAARQGCTELVRTLLEAVPAAAAMADTNGHTPLHLAIVAPGGEEAARLLLAAAPESAMTACNHGRLPLHWAAEAASPGAVQLLLEAAPAAALVPDPHGCGPLALAAMRRDPWAEEVVRLLVLAAPAATSMPDGRGNLPLHWAARNAAGSAAAVRLLLAAAPATAAAPNHHRSTPLHLVSEWGGFEAVAPLLAAAPAAATQLDGDLDSPLSCAASLGDPRVVALLLAAAPSMAAARNRAGRLPVDNALARLEQALEVGGGAWPPQAAAVCLPHAPHSARLPCCRQQVCMCECPGEPAAAARLALLRALCCLAGCLPLLNQTSPPLPHPCSLPVLQPTLAQTWYGGRPPLRAPLDYICSVAVLTQPGMPPSCPPGPGIAQQLLSRLKAATLRGGGDAALPLFGVVAAHWPLPPELWHRLVPCPCPGLAVWLPAVLARSAEEAACLVRHLPEAEQQRLRTAALCLGRAQRVHGVPLPPAIVWPVLTAAAAG